MPPTRLNLITARGVLKESASDSNCYLLFRPAISCAGGPQLSRGRWEEKVSHLKNELKAMETERMVELHRPPARACRS